MPSLSLSTSPSRCRAIIRVHKATSELLVGPDWTINMEICDLLNNSRWLAKDVVKEVKRRLHNKNPKVQLLALTLLETMVKNCGDYIHQHISDRKILDEMIKLVKKKSDIHVRDKIMILLDSWQEIYGGPGEKHSQYYWACDELRRSGILFPRRALRSTPPPSNNNLPRGSEVGFSTPASASSTKLANTSTTSEAAESLSGSILESMRNVVDLLDDMLRAMTPSDRTVARDEVIVDLVERCRGYQKKLMQMLTTTTDEELLPQGLEMNYSLQSVLDKHDAIASGVSLPNSKENQQQGDSVKSSLRIGGKNTTSKAKTLKFEQVTKDQSEEEKEEQDEEFGILTRRNYKGSSMPTQNSSTGTTEDGASSSASTCNALVLIDAPTPTPTDASSSNPKEQELIDLLSIVLTTSSTSSEAIQPPSSTPFETTFEAPCNNNYVAPWVQPQSQPLHSQQNFQSQYYQNVQAQSQQSYAQYSSYSHSTWDHGTCHNTQNMGPNFYGYPPSPCPMHTSLVPMHATWPMQNNGNSFQNPQYGNLNQPMCYPPPTQVTLNYLSPMQSVQHFDPFRNPTALNKTFFQGSRSIDLISERTNNNGTSLNGNALVTTGSSVIPGGQRNYVPPYKLFDDLNVFGSPEGEIKSGTYSSASANPSQNNGLTGKRQ